MTVEVEDRLSRQPLQPKTFLGVRLEDPGFDNSVYKLAIPVTRSINWLRRTDIRGELPREGAAFVFANHTDAVDLGLINVLSTRIGRSMRLVGRDTLFDPTIPEEVEVLQRTKSRKWLIKKGVPLPPPYQVGDEYIEDTAEGIVIHKAEDIYGALPAVDEGYIYTPFNPETATFKEKVIFKGKVKVGKTLKKMGNPIILKRGNTNLSFLKEVRKGVKTGQLTAMFYLESRTEQTDISNMMPGPAGLMRMYPDVPVVLVGMVNTGLPRGKIRENFFKTKVVIGEQFTFNQMRDGREMTEEETIDQLRIKAADLLAPNLPYVQIY